MRRPSSVFVRALDAEVKCNMGAGSATRLIRGVAVMVATLLLFAGVREAAAQERLGRFLGGAAVAFVAHESGHLLFDGAFGAGAGLRKVNVGPIPFFAITHHPVSPAREFAISSAGFWVQHATDELVLSRRAGVRDERAPFIKGMLAFNVLTSIGYAGVAFARRGPAERDTRGMAASARVDEPWIGAAVLAPAALDVARYYKPDVPWLKWASRATKIGGALLVVRAAR